MQILLGVFLWLFCIIINPVSAFASGDLIVNGKLSSGDLAINGKVGIGTGNLTLSDKLCIYTTKASTSTSTPDSISLGGTYSGAAGTNLKLKLYDDGTYFGGFGISVGQMDYRVWASPADHVFYQGTTELMRIKGSGNVGIGTPMTNAGGTAALVFGNGSRPSISTNYAGFYAHQDQGFNFTQMHVFDGYGHESIVSPHANDAPEWLYDEEDAMPMMVREVQYFLGYVRYTNQTRAARLSGMTDVEKGALSGEQRVCVVKETFEEHEARTGEKLTQLVWEEEQARIKQEMDAERQVVIDAKAELASSIDTKTREISVASAEAKAALQQQLAELKQQSGSFQVPEEYTVKPMPQRLQAALGK